MAHHHHSDVEHGCCCCFVPLLAILISTVLFLKWFLGIEDLEAIKRIFSGITTGRQHWLSNLFQVLKKTVEVFNNPMVSGRGRKQAQWGRIGRWSFEGIFIAHIIEFYFYV